MSSPRLVAIMGSGETAPTMIKTHRELLGRLGTGAKAVILDTPYGFQENAGELAQRAVEYFKQSVGHTMDVAGLTRLHADGSDDHVDAVAVEHGLNRVREADYVFAGPGSPTYALRQWSGTPLPDILTSKIRNGGIVAFSSAAALTLGRFTVPVYEIYKVGMEPHWLDGLDVLSEVGLNVAIIPHYDNAEGGHHDTRFCYLGQRRLEMMESMLPEDAHVIGIDEHTGLIIDLDDRTATVVGNGTVTVRFDGRSIIHESGADIPISALQDPTNHAADPISKPASHSTTAVAADRGGESLGAEIERVESQFDRAIESRSSQAAVGSILDLEEAIHRWSADTLQSDDMDRARASLRSMIVRLGDVAGSGLVDPRSVAEPYISTLLDLRARVRADKLYDLSDLIRDRLDEIGVEVRDTAQGATWDLRSTQ